VSDLTYLLIYLVTGFCGSIIPPAQVLEKDRIFTVFKSTVKSTLGIMNNQHYLNLALINRYAVSVAYVDKYRLFQLCILKCGRCFEDFWVTVCKTVRPILSDRCLSVLSITVVYCGQTVGWRTPLGIEVGFGPGHITFDGDLAPPQRGTAAPPIFGPCLLRPNGWMDQDATWYGGRPQPRRHCVR